MTNALQTCYTLGETSVPLNQLLRDLKIDDKIMLKPEENVFAIDNEAFRYLIAQGHDQIMNKYFKSFEESWKISASAMTAMLDKINQLKVKKTQKIVDLQVAYTSIQEMCKVSTQGIMDRVSTVE